LDSLLSVALVCEFWLDKWSWIVGFGLSGTLVLGSTNNDLARAGPLRGQTNMVLEL